MSLFNLENEITCQSTAIKTMLKNDVRLAKSTSKLEEIIGNIQPGSSVHYASAADWSMHDMIFYLAQKNSPVDIIGATWSVSEPAIDHFIRFKQAGLIRSMRMLFDWRVSVRTPGAKQLCKFNDIDFRVTTCHAKVALISGTGLYYSIIGSANFTNNPRIEAGVITESKSIHDFHASWILAEMKGAKPFGEVKQSGRKQID